jgi:hypothetical protein
MMRPFPLPFGSADPPPRRKRNGGPETALPFGAEGEGSTGIGAGAAAHWQRLPLP